MMTKVASIGVKMELDGFKRTRTPQNIRTDLPSHKLAPVQGPMVRLKAGRPRVLLVADPTQEEATIATALLMQRTSNMLSGGPGCFFFLMGYLLSFGTPETVAVFLLPILWLCVCAFFLHVCGNLPALASCSTLILSGRYWCAERGVRPKCKGFQAQFK